MLKNKFNPHQPLRFVRYGRMSSDRQNPRSPDQQFLTISETIKRHGYSQWQHMRDYRDDGISGRKIRQRPGLQAMLRDIRSGALKVDLILVDTFERFGRADEMMALRRELHRTHGVFLLTADSGFADPTSVSGRAIGFVESMRATEDTRIKAHNVLRGKKDAVRQKKWPGGSAPFGYRLESVLTEVSGRQEVAYSILVPDPEAARVIQLLFAQARATDFGCTRLTRFLNDHPEVPTKFKPFSVSKVLYWLQSSIYRGELRWERVNTEIIDDRRVQEKNPEPVIVPDFCEPLVSDDDWRIVENKMRARVLRMNRAKPRGNDKLIAPITRGIVLKYPLTGLVLCDECGRAMTPAASPRYVTAGGEERRYVGYACPAAPSGLCGNRRRIPEGWLRPTVINCLLNRLMHSTGDGTTRLELDASPVYDELLELVAEEVSKIQERRPSRGPVLRAEKEELDDKLRGWGQSLGRPDLPAALRGDIERFYVEARQRIEEIDLELTAELALEQQCEIRVDRQRVASAVSRLSESIAVIDPSGANIVLSMHIDSIRCRCDGTVVMRTCKLGVVPEAIELLRSSQEPVSESTVENGKLAGSKPRRRARRASFGSELMSYDEMEAHEFALDPKRFEGIPAQFFWVDELQVPEPTCWSKENAAAVAAKRAEGLTHERLAAHFGVTIPTIRKSLRIAAAQTTALVELPRKMPRRRWHEDHALDVRRLKDEGWSTMQLAKHFSVSDTTIRSALQVTENAPTSS